MNCYLSAEQSSLFSFLCRFLHINFMAVEDNCETQETVSRTIINAQAERMLADYGNAVLRTAYSYLHNMADAEEILLSLNPTADIIEVNTIEELSEEVGFPVSEIDSLPFQAENVIYTAYWKEIAEITYTGDEQLAVYRKGTGSSDISGDYNIYNSEIKISVNDYDVTLKGNDNVYSLAIWTDAGCSYSLSLSDGKAESEWKNILRSDS